MVFPVVRHKCESWTIKKAECWRIYAFEAWCWRRLLRVPWTARRSNQFIRKEITLEYSLKGLMLKLKFWYFGHLMRSANSLEKTPVLREIEARRRSGQQRMWWLDGITNSVNMNMSLNKLQEIVKNKEAWTCWSSWGCRVGQDWGTEQHRESCESVPWKTSPSLCVQVDPWSAQGLGVQNLHIVKNPHITNVHSQYPRFCILWSTNFGSWSTGVFIIEKIPHRSGPAQLRPVLFKSQLYKLCHVSWVSLGNPNTQSLIYCRLEVPGEVSVAKTIPWIVSFYYWPPAACQNLVRLLGIQQKERKWGDPRPTFPVIALWKRALNTVHFRFLT